MTSKSSTITERKRRTKAKKLPPVHPGEVLLEEFLKPLGISQYRLAKDISVPPRRVNEIVLHKRSITADTALRFALYFGTSEQLWLNLQNEYDLDVARDRLGDRLHHEVGRAPGIDWAALGKLEAGRGEFAASGGKLTAGRGKLTASPG